MPFKRENYPDNWEIISMAIRVRAEWKCEFCGAANYEPHPITGSKVVLTVAHLDHDTANNDFDNLRALCQKCHLTYDAQYHAENAKRTRQRKAAEARQAAGQRSLWD